jgi:ABC-2 type transport system permease protein
VWQAIARKELRGLWDSRQGKLGLGFVALVYVLGGYLLPTSTQAPTTADFAGYMTPVTTLLLPLVGLLLGYKTIVDERSSGRLTLLLSLPHSRRGAVLGKFAGRSLALAVVLSLGVIVGSWLVYYPFGSIDLAVLTGYLGLTLLYGVVFVGIGVAVSTLTRSNHLATAATFGVFFLFVVVWAQLALPLALVLDYLGLLDGGLPDWARFLHGLEPGMLYQRILDGFIHNRDAGPFLGPDAPWYLGERLALVLLVLWAVVPVSLGYLRFRGTDL